MLPSTIAPMTQALGAEQREGQEAQPRKQCPKAPSIGKTWWIKPWGPQITWTRRSLSHNKTHYNTIAEHKYKKKFWTWQKTAFMTWYMHFSRQREIIWCVKNAQRKRALPVKTIRAPKPSGESKYIKEEYRSPHTEMRCAPTWLACCFKKDMGSCHSVT